MSVKLKTQSAPADTWKKIDLYGGQDIEVAIRKPVFRDQLRAWSANDSATGWGHRVRSTVVDWRGVLDDKDQPVPFSHENLELLLGQYPQASHQLLDAVADAWVTIPEDEEKNLPQPPVDGGTETNVETTVSTTSSVSGESSEVASD